MKDYKKKFFIIMFTHNCGSSLWFTSFSNTLYRILSKYLWWICSGFIWRVYVVPYFDCSSRLSCVEICFWSCWVCFGVQCCCMFCELIYPDSLLYWTVLCCHMLQTWTCMKTRTHCRSLPKPRELPRCLLLTQAAGSHKWTS